MLDTVQPVAALMRAGRDGQRVADTPTGPPTATPVPPSLLSGVPVRGVLRFVDTELPWSTETVARVPLVERRGLVRLLTCPGDRDAAQREAVGHSWPTASPPPAAVT